MVEGIRLVKFKKKIRDETSKKNPTSLIKKTACIPQAPMMQLLPGGAATASPSPSPITVQKSNTAKTTPLRSTTAPTPVQGRMAHHFCKLLDGFTHNSNYQGTS